MGFNFRSNNFATRACDMSMLTEVNCGHEPKLTCRFTRTKRSGTCAQDLLWFRLDFGGGCASTSTTDNTLYFSIVAVVAYFVWRPTRLVESVEGFVAGKTRLVGQEVLIERVNKLWLQPSFVTI